LLIEQENYSMKWLNESGVDRIIRVVVGLAMLGLGLGGVVFGGWGVALAVVGGVFLVTGIAGVCPLYALLGLNTKKG
jgi:hypothetical protein